MASIWWVGIWGIRRKFSLTLGQTTLRPGDSGREGEIAMSKKNQKKSGDPMAKAMDMTLWQSARTDPQGSYTGTPADPDEVPVQDADDL